VADTRYLKRRRQGWYFQLAVPAELRRAFGKAVITASLGTRDLTLAQERRWPRLIEAKESLAKLAGTKPAAAEILPPAALLEIDELARRSYREMLTRMDADARKSVRAWNEAELDDAYREACTNYICDGAFQSVAEPLAAYTEQHKITAGSPHYVTLGTALLVARIRALTGRRRAILEGKPSDEPETFLQYQPIDPVTLKPLRAADTRRGGIAFAEVAERCLAEKQRDVAVQLRKQTEEQYRVAYRLFDQFARQPRLDAVDRRLASQFLDAIAGLNPDWGRGKDIKALPFAQIVERFGNHKPGLANGTLNKYVTALGIVWDYASKRDGYNGSNPWEGQLRPTTARRGSSETGKRGFTPAEIHKLLATQPDARPTLHSAKSALPWLTWIGAYSGMRLNETTGLDVADVKRVGDIWYFDLTQAKSEAGVRFVPVHSALIEAGFGEYLKHVKQGLLFPGLKPGGLDGKLGVYASKRFTVWRRALKLTDPDRATDRDRLDYHSLRRSVVTALKRAGISEADIAEVVGHEHPHITLGTYADRHLLTRLQAIVEAIRYD
jgi:integrase